MNGPKPLAVRCRDPGRHVLVAKSTVPPAGTVKRVETP